MDDMVALKCQDFLSTIYLITSSLNESSIWLLSSNRLYAYWLAVRHCIYTRPVYFPSYCCYFSSSSNYSLLYIRIYTVYIFFTTTLTFLLHFLQPQLQLLKSDRFFRSCNVSRWYCRSSTRCIKKRILWNDEKKNSTVRW